VSGEPTVRVSVYEQFTHIYFMVLEDKFIFFFFYYIFQFYNLLLYFIFN